MKKVDRIKELEKIADKLGIGQDKEVECVSCKSTINLKDAVILTNKKEVKYLCSKCNEKLEKGGLEKTDHDLSEILKELEKQSEKNDHKTFPPSPYTPQDWEPVTLKWEPKWIGDYTSTDNAVNKPSYSVLRMSNLLKIEPNYADTTNTSAN
jgi:hypothetical protein